ncbi:rubredoxin [Methanomassiliicoccaceae archaeon COG_1]|nr:rubredoxin [Methanomassiliicoccaceae archaeon COG_1]
MRKHVKGNVSWVGYMDWELESFHGDEYSIDNGSSQNAYLIEEEKVVLMDTVWTPHRFDFVENLRKEIDLKKIDIIVVNHGECDHSGSLTAIMDEVPGTPIYCTASAVKSIEGQFGKRGWDFHVVKTGDSLDIGNGKRLIFVEMKMLHWPDSMATFLTGDNVLFSMDAFGQHYSVEELYADLADQGVLWREAMKYYANILNPFSPVLLKKLKEMEGFNLDIEMVAPAHGAIWRKDPTQIIRKYAEWADAYQEDQVTVAYDTMWEGTAKIAHAISEEVHRQSPNTVVKVFNIAKADKNDIMTEVFKSKAICVGSPTVVGRILSSVAGWMEMLGQLRFRNKRAAAFGCYGWSGESVRILQEKLREAGFDVIDENVRSNWNPEEGDLAQVPALVRALLPEQEVEQPSAVADEKPSRYACTVCGHVYDPEEGDPDSGIPPGTPFESLPDDWSCPVCGVNKSMFKKMDH